VGQNIIGTPVGDIKWWNYRATLRFESRVTWSALCKKKWGVSTIGATKRCLEFLGIS